MSNQNAVSFVEHDGREYWPLVEKPHYVEHDGRYLRVLNEFPDGSVVVLFDREKVPLAASDYTVPEGLSYSLGKIWLQVDRWRFSDDPAYGPTGKDTFECGVDRWRFSDDPAYGPTRKDIFELGVCAFFYLLNTIDRRGQFFTLREFAQMVVDHCDHERAAIFHKVVKESYGE